MDKKPHATRNSQYVTQNPKPKTRNPFPKTLLAILALFTLLTLYNSFRLPLGEAADETDHYQYLRFVARTGHPPLTETQRHEAGFKGGLAPLYYWLTAWPIALVGENTLPDIRRVDSRPERHIPTDGLGLNHVLHTLDEEFPWQGQALAWHLVRFLSLPLAWVTIIATYALARRLLPEQEPVAVGAAAFVAFLPRFVISSAVINDDNLVFALTASLLLTQVTILQGDHRFRTFALCGALFGLSLVTKYFSLILIPEVIFTLFIFYVTGRKVAGRKVAGRRVAGRRSQDKSHHTKHDLTSTLPAPRFLTFLLGFTLTAVPWFIFIIIRFNRIDELGLIPGLAAALGEPQITEGLVGLLSGQAVRPPAATYPLPAWFSLLYRSFWFEYGWMQIFAPGWIYGLFTLFLLAALVGLVKYCVWRTPSVPNSIQSPISILQFPTRSSLLASPPTWLIALHLALFLIVVLARYVLSATIDTGQGRHLYPALPVIAFLISLGLFNLRFTTECPLGIDDLRFFKRLPSSIHPLLPAVYFLLLIFPSAFSLQPSVFILPHYRTLPVTITPPTNLPLPKGRFVSNRQAVPFANGLTLAGFDTPAQVSAGDALPVTLYWQANQEAEQDYLISLCLQDDQNRPVACWRGHLVDGHYPARAWEAGDTIIDTVFIPIPACYRIHDQTYTLRLELWPLAADSPAPLPAQAPILAETFAEPAISIQASDSLLTDLPQTADLWRANERLTSSTDLVPWETVTQITYAGDDDRFRPALAGINANHVWWPLAQFDTALHLPCDNGPAPFARAAHFFTDPTLLADTYAPSYPGAPPNLTLNLAPRFRKLAPLESTLSFSPYLSPLSLQLPDHTTIYLASTSAIEPFLPTPYSPLRVPTSQLPITIHWQAHRWMADPLVVSLKLLDKDYKIGGERIATLGDRYPNVLWAPTEIVEETYPLRIKPDAPAGLYRLELSVIHQDESLPDGFEYLPLTDDDTDLGHNLYPATFRLLDPAHNNSPSHPFYAQLGHAIELVGYDIDHNFSTQTLKLTLYWQSGAKIPVDYTVFTQLIGPDGQVWAQWDNPPQAGRYPTTAWTDKDTVVDRYTLTLRDGAPLGDYRLLVGMYDPTSGLRLPAAINGQLQPDQAIELTTLSLVP